MLSHKRLQVVLKNVNEKCTSTVALSVSNVNQISPEELIQTNDECIGSGTFGQCSLKL